MTTVASVWRWIPPALTAGFVMAGFIKGTGFLARLPVDLTLTLAGLTAATGVGVAIHRGLPRAAHGVILAYCLLLPPVLWSAPTEYGTDKVGRLLTFTFLAILAPVVLIRDAGDIARHLAALTAVSGVVVVTGLVDPQLSSDYEGAPISTDSVNTIGLGSAAGTVLVVLALGLIWKRIPIYVAVAGAAAAVYMLLQSGSRGPLLAAVLAVLVGSLLTRRRPELRRVMVFLALMAVGVLVAYSAAPLYSQRRIMALLQGETSGSVDSRIRLYHEAVESVSRHPFGIGWGSFEGITFAGYRWPHNLPLEVLTEAGVVFGGLFLVWMGYQIVRARRCAVDYVGCAVFAVMVFWLTESLVSSDFNDNRTGLYTLGLAIAAGSLKAVPPGRRSIAGAPNPAVEPGPTPSLALAANKDRDA